jgi:ribosomal-protein-serine acetyltransferase
VCESLEMLKPWMVWAHDGYTVDEKRAFIQSSINWWETNSQYSFVIVRSTDRALLGGCGLNHIDPGARLANLGYWVGQKYRGQGIAARAARLLARWGIERLGLLRAEIVVAVGNTASQRAALKSGATREGVLRNRILVGPLVHDAVMHSLTPQDFGLEVR